VVVEPVIRASGIDGRARVLVALGTRPEAIKLAPVIRELRRRQWADVRVVSTAQHRHMVDQVLEFFGIDVDLDLDLMREDQSLADLAGRMLPELDRVLESERPDLVVAQGDTTTVMVTGLCCFYRQLPFAHVEAGLRSGAREAPFPEEMNRAVLGWLADLHFAPTEAARQNLLRENVSDDRICVTGNTAVDALRWAIDHSPPVERPAPGQRPLLLVTAHRRENFGAPLTEICDALRELAETRELDVLFPVHPNPRVQSVTRSRLTGVAGVELVAPLDYPDFVAAMQRAHLILTDSGGVQEEAPSLGTPVLVLRHATERPEGVEAGAATVVGPDRRAIIGSVARLLDDPEEYARMAQVRDPYGDGDASRRIADALEGRVPAGLHAAN